VIFAKTLITSSLADLDPVCTPGVPPPPSFWYEYHSKWFTGEHRPMNAIQKDLPVFSLKLLISFEFHVISSGDAKSHRAQLKVSTQVVPELEVTIQVSK